MLYTSLYLLKEKKHVLKLLTLSFAAIQKITVMTILGKEGKLWTSSSDTILLNQTAITVMSSLLPKAWYIPHPGMFSMEICRRLWDKKMPIWNKPIWLLKIISQQMKISHDKRCVKFKGLTLSQLFLPQTSKFQTKTSQPTKQQTLSGYSEDAGRLSDIFLTEHHCAQNCEPPFISVTASKTEFWEEKCTGKPGWMPPAVNHQRVRKRGKTSDVR